MKSALSSREKQVLIELAKNSRLSDRELASKLRTSQPTITRIRTKLMQEGFLDRVLMIPDVQKLGIHMHAFTFVRAHNPAAVKKMSQWANEQPVVLFASEGEGLQNHTFVLESMHSDFSEYTSFVKGFREKFAGQFSDVAPFLVDSKSISKFYHWHTLIEDRVSKLKTVEWGEKKLSRSERFKQALSTLPNPLGGIPNPLKRKELDESAEPKTEINEK